MKELTVEQAEKHIKYMESKKLTIKYESLYNNLCELKEACLNKRIYINQQNYEKAAQCRDIERESLKKMGNDIPMILRNIILEEILNS